MSYSCSDMELKLKCEKENKVRVPMLFSFEKDNKTSYLLGTCHVLPLDELPDQCQEVIQSCKNFVTEETDKDALEFYTKAILRDENSPSWFKAMSSDVNLKPAAAFIDKMVENFFELFHPSIRRKVDELEIWAAYQIAYQGFMCTYAESAEANSGDELSMDHELILKVFNGEANGLENPMDMIPRAKQEANSISDLLKFYQEAHNDLNHKNSGLSNETTETIYDYRNGVMLSSSDYASESIEDEETIERNINWIPNIIRHHETLKGPVLFGVGAAHLVGEKGLLTLLPAKGYNIRQLKPNGDFEHYTYPFTKAFMSKLSLDRARYMLKSKPEASKKFECTKEANEKAMVAYLDKPFVESNESKQLKKIIKI